ncbi:MAG: hypothetical protein EBS77_08190 [Gammaproteobacteria bacterium]|nr:hypothetical protein [Gammaproteobacteria bacterium]
MRTLIIGLGRIGRLVARHLLNSPEANHWVGAVEITEDAALFAYLLNHDSTYGHLDPSIQATSDCLMTATGQQIPLFSSVEGALAACSPDLIIECSGDPRIADALVRRAPETHWRVLFSSQTEAVKGKPETFVWVDGVNHTDFDPKLHRFVVNPGCLNNCLIPTLSALNATNTILAGTFVSVHSVTSTQPVLDHVAKHARWSRAAYDNLIPAGHDPSQLIARFFPTLGPRLIGRTVRAPVSHTSYVTLTLKMASALTVETLKAAFQKSHIPPHVLGIDSRPLVSSDYRCDGRSAIIDGTSLRVLEDNTAFFSAWYNNEWAFAQRMTDIRCTLANL